MMDGIKVITVSDKKYKVLNGTYYHTETNDSMVELLETIRESHWRVRFHWGDAKTGADWGDAYDVAGTIGRSMGLIKIPLLIHKRTSTGGIGILDRCIVKIRRFKDNKVLYQHPNYHMKER